MVEANLVETNTKGLGIWLEGRCNHEKLSLRQAAEKTGLSHATIKAVIDTGRASPETIKKLAQSFSGNHHEQMALEDSLLILGGCRTERPEVEISEPLARLLDKMSRFNEAQLRVVEQFTDFISGMGKCI